MTAFVKNDTIKALSKTSEHSLFDHSYQQTPVITQHSTGTFMTLFILIIYHHKPL